MMTVHGCPMLLFDGFVVAACFVMCRIMVACIWCHRRYRLFPVLSSCSHPPWILTHCPPRVTSSASPCIKRTLVMVHRRIVAHTVANPNWSFFFCTGPCLGAAVSLRWSSSCSFFFWHSWINSPIVLLWCHCNNLCIINQMMEARAAPLGKRCHFGGVYIYHWRQSPPID